MSPMYSCIKTLNHTPKTCLDSARIFIRKVVRKNGFGENNSISIHVVIYTEIPDVSKGHSQKTILTEM